MVDKSEKFTLLVRLGYAARGVVYVLLGYLAVNSSGDIASGQEASFNLLQDVPFGAAVLVAVATGLLAYAAYKFFAATADLEHHGTAPKGIGQRIGFAASAVAHAVLAWTAFSYARGLRQAPSGDRSSETAASLLSWNMGGLLLGLIGLGFLVAAAFQARSAVTAHFMRNVAAANSRMVCWIGRFGHAARAVVFFIIGWSLVKSAWLGSGTEAKGLGSALLSLRESAALYTLVAVGLLVFGVFSIVVARFRIIPDVDGADLRPKMG